MAIVKKTSTGTKFLKKTNTGADTGIVAGGKFVDGSVPADAVFVGGNVGIDVQPTEKLSVQGIIESKSGGVKFPDATVQTTAAAGGKFVDGSIPADAVFTGGNVGIGEQPTEKMSVAGIVKSSTGGFKFPDDTVQTSAASAGASVDVAITNFTDSNGVEQTTQTILEQWNNPTKLTDLTLTSTPETVSWLYDDSLVAIGATLKIFSVVDDVFTELSGLPTEFSNVSVAEFSPNGKFLAVYDNTANTLKIYKRDKHTFTRIASSINLNAIGTANIKWSPDSELLVVTSGSTGVSFNYFQVVGDTFTQLSNPSVTWFPNTMPLDTAWSPNGEFLAVSLLSPDSAADIAKVTIFQRLGTTLTKLPDPVGMPVNWSVRGVGIAWSQDSQFLGFGISTSPYFMIFQRSGTTFTNISSIDQFPIQKVAGVAWGKSGKNLVLYQQTSPILVSYSQNDSTFTKIADLPSLGIAPVTGFIANEIKFSNTGRYLASPQLGGYAIHITTSQPAVLPGNAKIQNILDLGQVKTQDVVDVSITKFTDQQGNVTTKETVITPWESPTIILEQATTNAGFVRISPNGKYVAISRDGQGGSVSSPAVEIYKIVGDTYTLLTNVPASMNVASQTSAIEWSPDSSYLVVTSFDIAPLIFFYKRIGDTFVERTDITLPVPSFRPRSIAWGKNNILSINSDSGTNSIYQWEVTGDTFVRGFDVTGLSNGMNDMAWSNNGEFLAVAENAFNFNFPFYRVYQRSGSSTLTQIFVSPSNNAPFRGQVINWSIDDRFFAVGTNGQSFNNKVFIFERFGASFTDVSSNIPSTSGTNERVTAVEWSRDGKKFMFTSDGDNEVRIFIINDNLFFSDPAMPINSGALSLAGAQWNSSGDRIIVAASNLKFIVYGTSGILSLPAHSNVVSYSELNITKPFEQVYNKRIASATDITTSGQGIHAITDTSVVRTITLASADVLIEGLVIIAKDESGGASVNNITLATEGSETIDGTAFKVLAANNQSLTVYSDGTNWHSI